MISRTSHLSRWIGTREVLLLVALLLSAVAMLVASADRANAQTATNPANGHVYTVVGPATWQESENQAVALGGHLVTVNDADEQAWLVQTFGGETEYGKQYWIGFTDPDVEGTFVWISSETATYTNWYDGEPNNGGDNNDKLGRTRKLERWWWIG